MVDFHVTRAQLMQEYGFGPDVMKRIKVCRVCGCSCDAGETYCQGCGAVLPQETLFDLYRSQHLSCPACGTVVAKEARFCPHCGSQLWRETAGQAPGKPPGRLSHILHSFSARRSCRRTPQR